MISIIVPVLNEEKSIERVLEGLNRLEGEKEIIVVDGGSRDKTVEIASKYAKVIKSRKGRAYQMNKGAKEAKGDILWFVHSDSILDKSSLKEIEKTVSNGCIGGGFSLYFSDYNTAFMKFVSITSNWRAKYLKLFFGDQGIFVKRDIFNKLGGYPEIDIMEDWEFSRRLSKEGKIKILEVPIGTSARRFKKGGPLKTLLLMHKIKVLYLLGVPPSRLSKIYREAR
ncbi:TIGR04283 family arsenosugar biosynthesis glycosyltransferase [Thermohalobacter berrensis]|uniref:4,4'-diaponeurosporenoate glycosyltransferase n=1 Tax=Thermohalobacter berrensis TaxID=99594 RepID=A0A419SUY6_9FIRM|nr:TIGR04283 family arsenosugar biosynthesis glycosyltransferase [Thermohalobacter berrensis]RKD29025.1 glycosyl transferase [Thermohalobacter berrensis]